MKVLTALSLICCVRFSTACNGYSIKVLKYSNCVENSIIKLPEKDFAIVLDKDCNVYTTGCVEVTKDFKTAKIKYMAKKPPLPQLDGEANLCEMSGKLNGMPEVARTFETLGIPSSCPVKAKKICGSPENKISLGKFKSQIGMAAGNSEVKLEIEHDNGKSCIEIHSSLTKPRKG